MKVNVCNIFTAMPNLLQRREGCSLKQQFSDFIPVYQAAVGGTKKFLSISAFAC